MKPLKKLGAPRQLIGNAALCSPLNRTFCRLRKEGSWGFLLKSKSRGILYVTFADYQKCLIRKERKFSLPCRFAEPNLFSFFYLTPLFLSLNTNFVFRSIVLMKYLYFLSKQSRENFIIHYISGTIAARLRARSV